MRPVAPRVGLPEITLAEDQHEYLTLTAAVIADETGQTGVLTRWRLDDVERAAIAAGADVFVSLLTFGGAVQPMQITVDTPTWVPGE